jgi:hypothetical protein
MSVVAMRQSWFSAPSLSYSATVGSWWAGLHFRCLSSRLLRFLLLGWRRSVLLFLAGRCGGLGLALVGGQRERAGAFCDIER